MSKRGDNSVVKRRLQVMIAEMNGEPELPLGDDFDPETGEVFEGAGRREMPGFKYGKLWIPLHKLYGCCRIPFKFVL